MERIAEFHKVSYEQFEKDWIDTFSDPNDAELRDRQYITEVYDNLSLPVRATSGSAGYDFFSPLDFVLEPGDEIKIPTGVRVKIDDGWVLMVFPRSSLGFKFYERPANLIPVVDSDYFYSSNEGHVFIKIRNDGNRIMTINNGDKFCQGVFIPYGITKDDNVVEVRDGGFGSTGK